MKFVPWKVPGEQVSYLAFCDILFLLGDIGGHQPWSVGLTVNVHCQLDWTWSHLGDTPLGVSVKARNEKGRSTRSVRAPVRRLGFGLNKNEKTWESKLRTSIDLSWFPHPLSSYLPHGERLYSQTVSDKPFFLELLPVRL